MKIKIKNHKDIYEDVAKDLDLPVELVQNIGTHAWKQLKSEFQNMNHHEIYVLGLGSFRTRPNKMIKEMSYLETILENLEMQQIIQSKEGYQEEAERIKSKIERLSKLVDYWQEIKDESKTFKQNRDGKIDGDISEQDEDMGGTEE
jgi:hypothetical protein